MGVLIEESTLRPKLIDFGLSRRHGKQDKMTGGSVGWMAPEILAAKGRTHSDKVSANPSADIFSIGALAFFIATGRKPFAGVSKAERVQQARNGQLPDLQWPTSEVCWLKECEELSKRCMSCDVAARPSIAAVNTEIEAWLPESHLVPSSDGVAPCSWLAAISDLRGALEERGRRIPEHRIAL